MSKRQLFPSRRNILKFGSSAAAVSLFGVPTPAGAQALHKLTVVFPTRSAASWPMFCAKEGGFYEKYGLNVDLKFGVHPTGLAGLVSGDVHMTNPSLDQVAAAALRDPSVLVAMASMLNKGTFALLFGATGDRQRRGAQSQAFRNRPGGRPAVLVHGLVN